MTSTLADICLSLIASQRDEALALAMFHCGPGDAIIAHRGECLGESGLGAVCPCRPSVHIRPFVEAHA